MRRSASPKALDHFDAAFSCTLRPYASLQKGSPTPATPSPTARQHILQKINGEMKSVV
jgi:hypothetical protein